MLLQQIPQPSRCVWEPDDSGDDEFPLVINHSCTCCAGGHSEATVEQLLTAWEVQGSMYNCRYLDCIL